MLIVIFVATFVRAKEARFCTSLFSSFVDTMASVSSNPLCIPIRSAVSSHARFVNAPAARRRAFEFGSPLTVFFNASNTTPDPYVTSLTLFSFANARFCNPVMAYSRVSSESSITASLTSVPNNLSICAIGLWLRGALARSISVALANSLALSDKSNVAIFRTLSINPSCSSIMTLFWSQLARFAMTLIRPVLQSAFRIEVATRTRALSIP
mmetsp:Transcript_22796/g.41217  ORF Transcript_22796/g.41217 Transcript_22796/m.41217 type:complete len:211 (-) Transcript_22796:999-1631(-)